MKKRLLLIVPIVILCMMVFVKQTDAGYPTLNLTSDSKTISAGQKTQLKVGGVKASKIKWTTSNKKVATVSKKGIVTGVSEGKATVTGKYRGVKFTVKFTVLPLSKKYNKLLCEDDNISIYLEKIENGKIFLKFENNSSNDFKISSEYITLNDESYYRSNVSYTEIYSGLSRSVRLELYGDDYDAIPYSFSSGNLSAQFNYWDYSSDYTDEWIDEKINFSTTIK